MSNPQPPGTPGPEDIQRAINDATTKNDFPLEVKLETGQVYRGSTPQDVLNALVKAQEEASRTIKARETEMGQLREKVGELEAKIPPPPQDPHKAQNEQFFAQLAEKPTEAIINTFADKMGIPPDQLVPMLQKTIRGYAASSGAEEFMSRVPEYPRTPEAGQMMKDALGNREPTADNLELAYHQLRREGRIQPAYVPPTQIMNPNQPMPVLRGSAVPPTQAMDAIAKAQTMDLNQLKQVIEQLSNRIG